MSAVRVAPFGEGAVLVELEQRIDAAVAARAAAIADGWEALGHGPAVPAYASALLRFDPLRLAPAEAEAAARRLAGGPVPEDRRRGREIVIPTTYDGPDLTETAERSGMSVAELVALHSGVPYRAVFLGFMPGWAYLAGLDPRIRAPRLAMPRDRVPAGSVAVIDGQTGVYPFESPGGWRLIGRAEVRLFDPDADPPALIQAGDVVRFRPLS